MDYSQPFSVLNEKLRPRVTSSEKLYSSLNRLEDTEFGSLRNKSSFQRLTVLPVEPRPTFLVAEPEELKSEPECCGEQEDLVCGTQGEGGYADLLAKDSCLLSGLRLKDVDEEALFKDDSGTSKSGEADSPGELASEEMRDPSKLPMAGEKGSTIQACYIDGTLPDLLKSGRPLSRRRTLGHVSDTLKEVRREVELSRRRSIRLKAQVEKLQESSDGPGWSQHRERVTEEVLSILGLLHPLTEPESSQPEACDEENRLDAALTQLQHVARKLAISQTKKEFKSEKNGEGDSAILQQALRDRDEAIEKKKAMEAEVLRSKTEMMTLNNHLLEAAQKRLELSLELEAWKEDFQLILQQQIKSQQQAEQVQKKPSRLGILKRSKPTTQRPVNFPLSAGAPPTTNLNQIFMNRSSADCAAPTFGSLPTSGTRTWREKLRKGKGNRHGDQDATDQDMEGRRDDEGFQVVCLD